MGRLEDPRTVPELLGLRPHLKVLAVNTLAVVATEDACLEALTVLLKASRLLAVAAFVVASSADSVAFLLHVSSL